MSYGFPEQSVVVIIRRTGDTAGLVLSSEDSGIQVHTGLDLYEFSAEGIADDSYVLRVQDYPKYLARKRKKQQVRKILINMLNREKNDYVAAGLRRVLAAY